MDFGTFPTGWHNRGDLPNQVAVSTGSTVVRKRTLAWLMETFCVVTKSRVNRAYDSTESQKNLP